MAEQIKNKFQGKQLKIGYLLHNILQEVSVQYFKGIFQAAYDYNINLIIEGIGGHIKNNNVLHYDINFSMLNILDKNYFDGIIVWGSALNSLFFKNNNELLNFLEKLKPLPMVNIGLKLFDNPTIMTDNKEGIKKILKHLILDHGYKKIAFLKGPENHISDIQRYQTFLKTMEEYGLPVNKKLISPPCLYIIDQIHSSAGYFIEKIKNKELIPGKDMDVIVASNDHFAIELMNQLKNAGIKVPDEIAVTGFDDLNEGRIIEPNLTTVNSNLFQIGYKAMEMLIHAINNKVANNNEIYLPSELIIRRSCGCSEYSLIKEKKIDPAHIISGKKSFKDYINDTFKKLINEKLDNLNQNQFKAANADLIYKLFDNFISDMTENTDDQFLIWLNRLLSSPGYTNEAVITIKKLFSHLWSLLTLEFTEKDFKNKIYEILYQSDMNIAESFNNLMTKKIQNFSRYAFILRNINVSISNNFETDKILSHLEDILKELKIPDCYLFIFNELGNYKSPPKLIFSYKDNKKLQINKNLNGFKELLIPDFGKKSKSNYVYLFDTLSFKDQPLGYILLNIKGIDNTYIGYIYDTLTSIISSSYYGAIILDEIKKAEKEKENFLKVLANQNIQLKKAIESANIANKAKSSFLANISHEIKTPLTVITGLAEKIQYVQDKLEQQKYSNLIINETKKITELINQLLDISTIEAGRMKIHAGRLNLKKMMTDLKETYQVIAQKKGLDFNLVLDENIPLQVMADEMRIRQIIINLVGNAIKFTDKGGITITALVKSQDQEKICVLFKITDTGIGIPEEKHRTIFEVFQQAGESINSRYGGTGLGTAIAKQLVELMGGEIGVISAVGSGSTFWFTLWFNYVYYTKKNGNVINSKNEKKLHADKKKNILFIEDNDLDMKSTYLVLYKAGYNIDPVKNYDQIKLKTLIKNYDLVVMDLNNQKKHDCIKHIKLNHPSLPILIISDKKQSDDEIPLLNLGADFFVNKPYSNEELLARVSSLIRKKNGSPVNIVISDLEIDKNLKKVKRGEKIISLTPKEYCILEFLADNKNTVMDKTAISEYLWGKDTDTITLSRNIDVHIKNLRKKIDSGHEQKLLLTKRGIGIILADCNNPVSDKN